MGCFKVIFFRLARQWAALQLCSLGRQDNGVPLCHILLIVRQCAASRSYSLDWQGCFTVMFFIDKVGKTMCCLYVIII